MASRIYRIVAYVESRFSSFAVSRLIMLSRVKVRHYTLDDTDDPARSRQSLAGGAAADPDGHPAR